MSTFAPISLIATVNILEGPLLSIITLMERWDFEHQRLRLRVWREFAACLLNNIVFVMVYSEDLFETPIFLGKGNYVVEMSVINTPTVRFASKEDIFAT